MKTLQAILQALKGYKTYIVSVLTAIYGVLSAFGIIILNSNQKSAILILILCLYGTTFRDALNTASTPDSQ